jgi:hypothetical protein
MYFSMGTLRLSWTTVQSDGAPFPAATFANDKESTNLNCYARPFNTLQPSSAVIKNRQHVTSLLH